MSTNEKEKENNKGVVGSVASTLYAAIYNPILHIFKTITFTTVVSIYTTLRLYRRYLWKGKSGFGAYSAAEEVAKDWDGKGKVAIVTGAFTGIGTETAKVLASRGCEVILAGRGKERGEKVVQEHILKDYPEAKTRVLHLDLSSLQSVKDFCVAFLELGLPLHILINNAGVAGCPFKLSQDGYELQFATNHLGHFLLTRLLLDHMKSSCPPGGDLEGRIVNVSSEAHKSTYKEGILPKDKLNCKSAYKPWKAYGQSKLANVYFSEKLDEELKKDGANIISTALMPGIIATDLSRHTAGNFYINMALLLFWPISKGIPGGASTTIYCAIAKDLQGGAYYEDNNISTALSYKNEDQLRESLWNDSVKYVKKFM